MGRRQAGGQGNNKIIIFGFATGHTVTGLVVLACSRPPLALITVHHFLAMEEGSSDNECRRIDLEMKRDPDMWMGDGNVVIAAVDETGEEKGIRLFRCHMSVLAKHSTVFEDLFALARGLDAEEYEGLPLVTVTADCNDVKGLLRILYDPLCVSVC